MRSSPRQKTFGPTKSPNYYRCRNNGTAAPPHVGRLYCIMSPIQRRPEKLHCTIRAKRQNPYGSRADTTSCAVYISAFLRNVVCGQQHAMVAPAGGAWKEAICCCTAMAVCILLDHVYQQGNTSSSKHSANETLILLLERRGGAFSGCFPKRLVYV